jgi:hypothetical protein
VQNMMRNKCETYADRNERETSKKTKQTWKLVWFRLRLLISPATNHLNHTKQITQNHTKLHLKYTKSHLNHTELHLNHTWITLNHTESSHRIITPNNHTWITPNHHTSLHPNHTKSHLDHTESHQNRTWKYNRITHNYTWITTVEQHRITPELNLNHTELHLNHTWITSELHLNSPQNQLKGEILQGALLEITTPKTRIPNNNARGLKQIVNRLADN